MQINDTLQTVSGDVVKVIQIFDNGIRVKGEIGEYYVDNDNVAERYYHYRGGDIKSKWVESKIVIKFIQDFTKKHPNELIETFTEGYCYWFAHILATRFSGDIYYLPISNHFIVKISNKFYDITGEICNFDEVLYSWEEYKKLDSLETERIINNCILKV